MLSPETTVRLAIFSAVFAVVAGWELVAQRRQLRSARRGRWFANLAIVALDAAAVRIVFPLGLAGIALLGEQSGWGLFNRIAVPAGLSIVASVVVLDFAVYVQHVAFHSVPHLLRQRIGVACD
jgi:sterol desaturase/sphingolipid hydroxylase (fatty acid hydroxylase superfamily)